MAKSFGPWSSEIYSGSPDKMLLSTFWKQRLAMLLPTSRLNARVLRRTWGAVLAVATMLVVLPAVRAVPAQPPENAVAAISISKADDTKAKATRRGHLYVRGLAYKNDEQSGLWIVRIDPKTGAWSKLLDAGNDTIWLRVSPDGQTIAYNVKREIWTADSKTAANPGKISEAYGIPVWSPDGKSIVVTHSKKVNGEKSRYKRSTWKFTDTGANREPVDSSGQLQVEDWSPDGKWLVFVGGKGLRLISPDGKRKRHLVNARGWYPRFSPDGKQIAFNQGWSGELKVTDLEGKNIRTFFKADNMVHTRGVFWAPAGKQVATLLKDMQLNAAGEQTLSADPKQTRPRIAIVDLKSGKHRVLKLPVIDGVRFEPTEMRDWR